MRLTVLLSLLFSHLFIAVKAANPIFGAFSTPGCEACLDQVFSSCPNDYQTRGYAECMCAGQGGENTVSCISQCDAELNEPKNAVISFWTYCVTILKEACPYAESELPQTVFDRYCSSGATATSGLGSGDASPTTADSDPKSATISVSKSSAMVTATSGLGSGDASPTTADSDSKSATISVSKSSAIATAALVPAWAVVAGLGVQAINLNL